MNIVFAFIQAYFSAMHPWRSAHSAGAEYMVVALSLKLLALCAACTAYRVRAKLDSASAHVSWVVLWIGMVALMYAAAIWYAVNLLFMFAWLAGGFSSDVGFNHIVVIRFIQTLIPCAVCAFYTTGYGTKDPFGASCISLMCTISSVPFIFLYARYFQWLVEHSDAPPPQCFVAFDVNTFVALAANGMATVAFVLHFFFIFLGDPMAPPRDAAVLPTSAAAEIAK